MNKFKKNAILNLIFNYSNIVFSLITGVFLVPLYLRHLSLDAYGSFLVASGVAALIGLLEAGLSTVTTQRLAKCYAQFEATEFRRIAYAGIVAASILFVLTILLTLLTATQISWLTKIDPTRERDLITAFILLGFSAALNIHINFFGSIFQAQLKSGVLGTVNLIAALIGIGTVVAAFSAHPSLTAIAAGTLVRMVCATLLLLFTAIRSLRSTSLLPEATAFADIVQLLRACGPIFAGSIAKSVAENSQILLLAHAASPATLAVLALTQKALQVCNMVLAPIGSSIFANLTHLKNGTQQSYFSSLLGIAIRSHFLLSVTIISTASVLNETFVSVWVGHDKFGGVALSILLGIATLLVTRFSFSSFLIYSLGDFKKPLTLEICYSIARILILLLLIDRLHLYAIPVADIAAALFFLFHQSIRTLIPHLKAGSFGRGVYYKGWLEFLLITNIGLGLASHIEIPHSWLSLAVAAAVFLLAAVSCVLLMNASFVKGAIAFQKINNPSSV